MRYNSLQKTIRQQRIFSSYLGRTLIQKSRPWATWNPASISQCRIHTRIKGTHHIKRRCCRWLLISRDTPCERDRFFFKTEGPHSLPCIRVLLVTSFSVKAGDGPCSAILSICEVTEDIIVNQIYLRLNLLASLHQLSPCWDIMWVFSTFGWFPARITATLDLQMVWIDLLFLGHKASSVVLIRVHVSIK